MTILSHGAGMLIPKPGEIFHTLVSMLSLDQAPLTVARKSLDHLSYQSLMVKKNIPSCCFFLYLLLLLLLSHFSHVRLCVTPWTAAHQAPPSMGFSRQEYRSGLPLPSPSYIQSYIIIIIELTWNYISSFYQRINHTFGNVRKTNFVKQVKYKQHSQQDQKSNK